MADISKIKLPGDNTEYTIKDSGAARNSHSHIKSEITDFPTLATVATSGLYNDLSNKPPIPTKTSQLTNDSGFITSTPVTSVAGKTGAVTLSKSDVGLGNVGNFKAVSTVASQNLTDTEKSNARANIGAAASSHGTHVSFSTTNPVMDGTASVGSASTVARSDHKHPTDTTRAAASDLTSHTGNKSNPHGVTLSQLGVTATATELNYCDGVTSNIQTQLNNTVNLSDNQTISGIKTFNRGIKIDDMDASIQPRLYTNMHNSLYIDVGEETFYMNPHGVFHSSVDGTFIGSNTISNYAVTGIKGDAESSYRKGNVNITAANIGAAASSHTHSASNITAGTLGGKVIANTSAVSGLTDKQLRNITISTAVPTSSDGENGDIWLVY